MKCILIHTPTYLPPIQFQPDELFGPGGEKTAIKGVYCMTQNQRPYTRMTKRNAFVICKSLTRIFFGI